MKNALLSPVVAFLIYFLVVLIVSGLGKLLSPKGRKNQFKSAAYASGEENDPIPAAPGYRQFFVIALFQAGKQLDNAIDNGFGTWGAAGDIYINWNHFIRGAANVIAALEDAARNTA